MKTSAWARAGKLILHFIIAGVLCAVTAILMHTQMVLAGLSDIDISVPFADRLYMTFQDLVGLLPKYGVIVLIGLAIAFTIAKGIAKTIEKVAKEPLKLKTSNKGFVLYPLAGGVAILAIMLLMQPILDITLLAGARTILGMALQVLAGAFGGLIFAYLRVNNRNVT